MDNWQAGTAKTRTSTGYLEFTTGGIEAYNFSITEIAHSLSQTVRYNGQGRKFYSVAEHCVLLGQRLFDGPSSATDEEIRHALLHDGAEAFIGDMIAPVKSTMTAFQTLEKILQDAINNQLLGPDWELCIHPDFEKEDIAIRDVETEILYSQHPFVSHEWVNLLDRSPVNFWSPSRAKAEFLDRWTSFGGTL